MMNSLRLELMDEAALVTEEGEEGVYFHDLCVVGGALVQLLVLNKMPATGVFCPEKARESGTFYKIMDSLPQARMAQPALVAAVAQEFPLTEWPLDQVNAEE
jgi:hypothetical protein